jgi:type IV pilus assembly protein PilC
MEMPVYRYRAINKKGRSVRGRIDSPDETELRTMLREEGLYPLSYKRLSGRRPRPFKAQVLAELNRRLGRLTGAGIPLTKALNILLQEGRLQSREKTVYKTLINLLGQGLSFSAALVKTGVFPQLMISIYKAAEEGGRLTEGAARLAELYEKEHKLVTKLKGSSAYTKTLVFAITAVLSLLYTFILPKFEPMFAEIQLPGSTKLLFGFRDIIVNHSLIILVFIAVILICFFLLKSLSVFIYFSDKLKLSLPLIGGVMSSVCTARFARTFNTLYSSGLPFVSALEGSRAAIGNDYLYRQLEGVINEVSSGSSLSSALVKVKGFRSRLAASILVGEEAGALEKMLSSVSEDLDFEAEAAVSRLVANLEPALIILMSCVVGFIMTAVFLPVLKSYSAIQPSMLS